MQSTLIIGGGAGIRAHLTKNLIEINHSVCAIARSDKELPSQVEYFNCDPCDFKAPLPKIEKEVNALVYLSGTINLKPFKQLTLEDFEEDLRVNFLGAVRAIKEYLPLLQKQESASIVLLSSVAAKVGLSFHASVGSAKSAVQGFMLSLSAELAPQIRVNAVSPSLTSTPLSQKLLDTEAKKEHCMQRNPLNKIGHPQDIAKAIEFLLSENARWITGQVLHVDGGFSSLRPI